MAAKIDVNVATLTAVIPATGNQTTQYLYGTSLETSSIARNDLLVATIYPDAADSTDNVQLAYNLQSQIVQWEEQNGNVLAYMIGPMGRTLTDATHGDTHVWSQSGSGSESASSNFDYGYSGSGSGNSASGGSGDALTFSESGSVTGSQSSAFSGSFDDSIDDGDCSHTSPRAAHRRC